MKKLFTTLLTLLLTFGCFNINAYATDWNNYVFPTAVHTKTVPFQFDENTYIIHDYNLNFNRDLYRNENRVITNLLSIDGDHQLYVYDDDTSEQVPYRNCFSNGEWKDGRFIGLTYVDENGQCITGWAYCPERNAWYYFADDWNNTIKASNEYDRTCNEQVKYELQLFYFKWNGKTYFCDPEHGCVRNRYVENVWFGNDGTADFNNVVSYWYYDANGIPTDNPVYIEGLNYYLSTESSQPIPDNPEGMTGSMYDFYAKCK